MVLSRFWSAIIVSSLLYIFVLIVSGRLYTIGYLVNGKQNDPLVVSEISAADVQQHDPLLYTNILSNRAAGFQSGESLYQLTDNGVIQVSRGKQPADGIFVTCKTTILDLWLPLIGYLTFFCGLLNLLNDSNALGRLARVLTPLFVRTVRGLPPGHPAYGFMTMNFAANFLGLDNAATPFGLKAMESMQEVNKNKDKASDSQIMFLCLHAAGLTLIPTSIIGYRAAQKASNPADVMLPCIITSFIGTLAALVFVGLRQRIRLLNGTILAYVAGISAVM